MSANETDSTWEYYGRNDPYFGVLTQSRYSTSNLDEAAKREFFETGERYVDWLFATIRQHLQPSFNPAEALDFGCGVGRLVLPLARRCRSVIGVDVSESMLAVAAGNAQEAHLDNVTFVKSDDQLSRVQGRLDFVHSLIVFQHIPPQRGTEIFRRLVTLLRDDGVGALQLTYSHAGTLPWSRRLLKRAKQSIPLLAGTINLLRGNPFKEPVMQMNEYDLNAILSVLQESQCHEVMLRFTETSVQGHGFYGVILLFRKKALDVRAHA